MRTVHNLVRWLGISDGNMQEGSFRCDANVSVRPRGSETLGTRAEIKNVNSFRFVEKALQYEIERQIRALESGEKLIQETRLYDPAQHRTRSMRGKESAHDYRYFPDPDLPPLRVPPELVERERDALPELPAARRARYQSTFGLSAYDAEALTADHAVSEYFEALLEPHADAGALRSYAKLAANWVNGELAAALNADQLPIEQARVAAAPLKRLLRRLHAGEVSQHSAKQVFAALWSGEDDPDRIIEARGLAQVRDDGELLAAVDAVIAANPSQVAQFRAGDEKVFGWLMGQAMRATRGKAEPGRLGSLLRARIAAGA
jgi:aspartyl-tRNA(Asn)/glutamyl-tRNA(Gln) amidotransferase subunit B